METFHYQAGQKMTTALEQKLRDKCVSPPHRKFFRIQIFPRLKIRHSIIFNIWQQNYSNILTYNHFLAFRNTLQKKCN